MKRLKMKRWRGNCVGKDWERLSIFFIFFLKNKKPGIRNFYKWLIIGIPTGRYFQSCSSPLGLEDYSIPDLQISSSLPLSRPNNARLNNPNSAWCFNYTEVKLTFLKTDIFLFFFFFNFHKLRECTTCGMYERVMM